MGQEFRLFRRGFAAENLVAVGKAAKTGDDVAVKFRIAGPLGISQPGNECHRLLLIGQILAVLQWQVEEELLGRAQLFDQACLYSLLGNLSRKRIASVGFG